MICSVCFSDQTPPLARWAEFFLGRSADGLDGLQCGAGFLRALGHEAPADPGLDGDHREGVGHDVVQFTGDAHPLLPDLLAGAFGLGGSRLLGLGGQPGQVAPARRDAVADEPACHQRQEAFHGPGGGGRVPGRERRVHERSAESRGAGRGGGDRHASRQARGGEVRREPEHDAERQRGVARGHDHRVSEGCRRQHRQWPAPQRRDQAAYHEREEKAQPPVERVRSAARHGQRYQRRAHGEHGYGRPLGLAGCCEQRSTRRGPGRMIPSHSTDGNQRIRRAHRSGG